MAAQLVTVGPPTEGVYRLAHRLADPFAPPDWQYADEDGTFGNRFDDPGGVEEADPTGRFRVIYCATQRAGAFGETLARFRLSLPLLAGLEAINDDESLEESLGGSVDPQDTHRGLIPADWRLRRHLGHTRLDPNLRFVDVDAGASIQHLRAPLAALAVKLGKRDVDLSVIAGAERPITQACARYIYEQVDDEGQPAFAGIRYLSRLNAQWECWAVFDDRLRHEPGFPSLPASIFPDDPDLETVAHLFEITIQNMSGHDSYSRP